MVEEETSGVGLQAAETQTPEVPPVAAQSVQAILSADSEKSVADRERGTDRSRNMQQTARTMAVLDSISETRGWEWLKVFFMSWKKEKNVFRKKGYRRTDAESQERGTTGSPASAPCRRAGQMQCGEETGDGFDFLGKDIQPGVRCYAEQRCHASSGRSGSVCRWGLSIPAVNDGEGGENVWSSVGFFSVRIVSPDGHAARCAPSLTHNFSSKVIPKSDKANEKNPP